jgi:hypothetical protein
MNLPPAYSYDNEIRLEIRWAQRKSLLFRQLEPGQTAAGPVYVAWKTGF